MELLVRIVDKEGSPLLGKRGDVIHVAPDGHQWGKEELSNPDWRIIHVPDLSQVEADALLANEKPPDLDKQYTMLRKRAFRLRLAGLDLTSKRVSVTIAQMRTRKEAKQRLLEPDELVPRELVR